MRALFKTLVKRLHPELARDADNRAEREALPKEPPRAGRPAIRGPSVT